MHTHSNIVINIGILNQILLTTFYFRVKAALTHAHIMYQLPTTPSRLEFNIMEIVEYPGTFDPQAEIYDPDLLEFVGDIPHAANLYVAIKMKNEASLGVAMLGTVCYPDRKKRMSMNTYHINDLISAQV